MIIVYTAMALATEIQKLKEAGQRIGFVPTMGALHAGHMTLVRLAKETAEKVVVSIFVNPTQFAPHEDFGTYPRQVEVDLETLKTQGADLVYVPTEADIYPNGVQVTVKAGPAADGLESDFRPHFFDGVATVVHTLFAHVRPDIAVFGEKDFQQLQVIREMVETEKLGIRILGAPIARDDFGLALSSRNAYLDYDELKIARTFNVVLRAALRTKDFVWAKEQLRENGFQKVDYVEERWGRVLAAVWIGKTRLIDNASL